jgi:hypothetical protein
MSENAKLPSTFGGPADGDDGFGFVADATGGPRAHYLRFSGKTGQYTLNGEPRAPGMRLIVGKATAAWVRLSAGERPERVFQEPGKPVWRKDLPDQDQELWEIAFGKKQDPWKEELTLYCVDPETGVRVVFSIMSPTGRNAVSDFCRLISFQKRQQGPDAFPLVEFGRGDIDGAFGITPVPRFTIVDWVNGAPELPPATAPDATSEIEKRPVIDPQTKTTEQQSTRRKAESPRRKAPDVPWSDELDDLVKY